MLLKEKSLQDLGNFIRQQGFGAHHDPVRLYADMVPDTHSLARTAKPEAEGDDKAWGSCNCESFAATKRLYHGYRHVNN